MKRFIAAALIVAPMGVGYSTSHAQEIDDGEAVIERLSASELEEIDAFLTKILPERAGVTGAVLVTEVDEVGAVVKETLLLPETVKNLHAADGCRERFELEHTWDDGALTTNVWCQAPNYNETDMATRRLQWDKYRHNRYFHQHVSLGIACFTSSGTPNYTVIIRAIHDKLCQGTLP